MPQVLNEDTTITTTVGKIIDFAADLCAEWAPAFYISITRDGKKEFSRHRFNMWLIEYRKKLNWNNLYPDNVCNARLKSGKNKGMRCSKKAKVISEVKELDGIEYKEERETPFCGLHQNLMDKDMLQEERSKLIYGGEPPMKNESKKIINLKKRLVKVHNSLKFSDDPTEEDIVKTVEALCDRMNKVELDRVRTFNALKNMRKLINKIPGVDSKLLDEYDKEVQDDLRKSYTGKVPIIDEVDTVKWSHIPFKDVAPQEMKDELARKTQEKMEKHMANYKSPREMEERRKRLENSEKKILEKINPQGKVVIPTAKEVAEGSRSLWAGPSIAIRVPPEPKKIVQVSGVGMNIEEKKGNPLGNMENTTVDNRRGEAYDMEASEEKRKALRSGIVTVPFKDPSTDYLQNKLLGTVVKEYGPGKKVIWVKYYTYVLRVTHIYNICHRRVVNRNPEEEKDAGLDEVHEILIDKMHRLMTRYSLRPTSKPYLLNAVMELDQGIELMKHYVKITSEELYNLIGEPEPEPTSETTESPSPKLEPTSETTESPSPKLEPTSETTESPSPKLEPTSETTEPKNLGNDLFSQLRREKEEEEKRKKKGIKKEQKWTSTL